MDYDVIINLFGKYKNIIAISMILLPAIWKLMKEGWELYNVKTQTNLEILDKVNSLFKEILIDEEKNLEKLIKAKTKDTIFGLLTGRYNTSEDYKNKICFLTNKFPQYNIKYLMKISHNIKVKNEKIYSNLTFFDEIGYWYFRFVNVFFMLASFIALFMAFIKSPIYIIVSVILFLVAFFQYKIIEDISLAKKFCKKYCNEI